MKTVILLLFIFLFSCARKEINDPSEAMRSLPGSVLLSDDLPLEEFQRGLKKHIVILMKKPERVLTFGKKNVFSQIGQTFVVQRH